ncbi:DNA-binding response regulator [Bifidobacterium goeldii]|uniref:DNA-binding response regulator n=1 Tax=Bifidobacterium goeldii TaxID=2306975 RepID=A0A430FNJ0_9BIFI|nr:response regulator transcription factor [Bifidobacterium goeldii]RSX54397.1 DNA-binding response regulator [Bifidobacterium goeldii]
MARLLLVEDESRMAQAVAELLRREGYAVDVCGDGESGAQAIRERTYDAMILDVMLPGRSGTSLATMTRDLGLTTPIIMLTAKTSVDDKVTGLDSGADDYLTKPFAVPELLARVRAQLRRVGALDDHAACSRTRTFADLSWDVSSLTLRCTTSGQSTTLSQRESALFETLLDNADQVLSRDQLRAAAWPQAYGSDYNSVEVYCSFLRRKLAFVGSTVQIRAVRGLGYVLRDGKDS